jgi:hypothetical protein
MEHAMFFGLSPQVFIHVVISLVAIAVGFVVILGMLKSQRLPWWTAWFLALTVTTSATGIVLPPDKILPAHILAVLSFVALAVAIYALYSQKLAGKWRAAYVIAAIASQYLNVSEDYVSEAARPDAIGAAVCHRTARGDGGVPRAGDADREAVSPAERLARRQRRRCLHFQGATGSASAGVLPAIHLAQPNCQLAFHDALAEPVAHGESNILANRPPSLVDLNRPIVQSGVEVKSNRNISARAFSSVILLHRLS